MVKCKRDLIVEGLYQDHFVLFDDAFTEALHRWAPKKTFVFYFLQIKHNSSLLGLPASQIITLSSCFTIRLVDE